MNYDTSQRQVERLRGSVPPALKVVQVGMGEGRFGVQIDAPPHYTLVLGTVASCEVFFMLYGGGLLK